MATRYRNLPKIVPQKSADLCWAAALESWLEASNRRVIKRDDLPTTFYKYLITIGGMPLYLDPRHLFDVASDGRIRMELFGFTTPGSVTSETLARALEAGPVYLCKMSAGGIGHCVVVYGVGFPDGKTEMVSYMDPWIGNYKNEALADLRTGTVDVKFGIPK